MIEMSLIECAEHCLLAIGVAGALALVWPSRTVKKKEDHEP